MSRRDPARALCVTALAASATALLAAVLAPARPAASAPPAAFAVVSLRPGGPLTEVVDHDLDGDGRRDLVLVSGRRVFVHRHRAGEELAAAGGPFGVKPEQLFRLDRRAIVFDLADLDRDGAAELIAFAEDGVFYNAFEKERGIFSLRRPRLLPEDASGGVLRRPTRDEVRWKDLVRDLDGDGAEELLVPSVNGYDVWHNDGAPGAEIALGGPVVLPSPLGAQIRIGPERPSSKITHRYWYPEPFAGDIAGDGRTDVVIPHEDLVLVFRGDRPYSAGAAMEIDLASVRRRNDGEKKGLIDLDRSLPTRMWDVDGNGVLDIVTTHIGDGVTRVYMGGKGTDAAAYARPDRVVRSGGISFLTHFQDLDGDGHHDLILARTAPIGALRILSVLVTREVEVDALVFFGRADGSWPSEPDLVREVEIPLLVRSSESRTEGITIGADVVVTLEGDHTGDGRCDLVVKTGPTTLSIYPLRADRTFEDDPLTVTIPSTEGYRFVEARVRELNGDDRADILLRYYSWDQDDDRLVAIVSQ